MPQVRSVVGRELVESRPGVRIWSLYPVYILYAFQDCGFLRRKAIVREDCLKGCFGKPTVSSAAYPASWHREFTGGLEIGHWWLVMGN